MAGAAPARPAGPCEAIGERTALLGLCYRLLGSFTDAEDAVQETYVRWYRLSATDRDQIRSPRAWLITTASRIGLDMLTSARARRERYVGEWLPEPLPTGAQWTSHGQDPPVDPADRIGLDESVSMALLIVLESMTPAERVAFILHDVFGYPYAEVAEIVRRTPAACRQLASSARRHVRDARHTPVAGADHAAVVRSFRHAWQGGDLAGLLVLLDPEVTATVDGGGLVTAPVEPVRGAAGVADLLLGVYRRQPDLTLVEAHVNGVLGVVAAAGGRTLAVVGLTQRAGAIQQVWAMRNPDKLRAWV